MITAPLYEVRDKVEKALVERLCLCIQDTRKKWAHDFFIIVQYLPKRKQEQQGIQINVAALEAIPTPTFDTTLFKYSYETESLDMLWTLPNEHYAINLYQNREHVAPEDYAILDQVIKYYDGTIFKMIAEWENSSGTIKREREHTSRDITGPRSELEWLFNDPAVAS